MATTLALLGDASPPSSGHMAKERKAKLPVLTSQQEPKQWEMDLLLTPNLPWAQTLAWWAGWGCQDVNSPTLPFLRPALGIAACPPTLHRAQGRMGGHLGVTQSLFVHRDPAEHRESRGRKASEGTR